MNKQMRLYCGIALAISVSSTAFGLYEKDDAFKQSHLNGVLYYQNIELQEKANLLEGKLRNAERETRECPRKK